MSDGEGDEGEGDEGPGDDRFEDDGDKVDSLPKRRSPDRCPRQHEPSLLFARRLSHICTGTGPHLQRDRVCRPHPPREACVRSCRSGSVRSAGSARCNRCAAAAERPTARGRRAGGEANKQTNKKAAKQAKQQNKQTNQQSHEVSRQAERRAGGGRAGALEVRRRLRARDDRAVARGPRAGVPAERPPARPRGPLPVREQGRPGNGWADARAYDCAWIHLCVSCACVHACVRACVRACGNR